MAINRFYWHLPIIFCLCLSPARAADAPDLAPPIRDPSLLVRLVRSEALQTELALSTAQCQSIRDMVAEVEGPLFQLRDVPATEKRDRLEPLANQVEKALNDLLTVAQRDRLRQIMLRAYGWPALLVPEQVQALGLSAQQTRAIGKLLEELAKAADNSNPAVEQKILAVLSDNQQNRLQRLTGAPFDFTKVPQVACAAPELRDVTEWINARPTTLAKLQGQVVALHFFAFGCSNCINNHPHYKAWHEKYEHRGLTVIGIHTPETARERDVANLKADVLARGISYPIAVDSKSSNWAAWSNRIWPSVYLIDKRGRVRYWWYGELNWQGARGEERMRKNIEELLAESD